MGVNVAIVKPYIESILELKENPQPPNVAVGDWGQRKELHRRSDTHIHSSYPIIYSAALCACEAAFTTSRESFLRTFSHDWM